MDDGAWRHSRVRGGRLRVPDSRLLNLSIEQPEAESEKAYQLPRHNDMRVGHR